MNRPLSPLQIAILGRVQRLDRVPEEQLRSYLAESIHLEFGGQDQWEKEFHLAVDLLCLYGAMRVEDLPREGRVFVSTKPPGSPTNPANALREAISIFERLRAHAAVPVMASALLGAGCTLIPSNEPSQPAPRYNPDGWMAPSRIEQFFNRGKMVYRYCVDDECPSPTPKIPAIAQAPRTIEVDPVPSPEHPVPVLVKRAEGKSPVMLRYGQATSSAQGLPELAATVISPAPEAALPAKRPILVAAGPEARLKLDAEFDSYKGVVSFASGSMMLDGLSRQKVAELAPKAQEAERVRLRGRAGAVNLTEELKKLAVGRAYAVKMEFVKHDVAKDKIRILNPRENDLLDGGAPRASINRSVDVTFDMPNTQSPSAKDKEGA